jgi:hypothetical protein
VGGILLFFLLYIFWRARVCWTLFKPGYFMVRLGKPNKKRIFKKDKTILKMESVPSGKAKKLYTPSFTAIQTINHPRKHR